MKLFSKFLFLPLLFFCSILFSENLPKAPNFVLNDTKNNKVVLTGLQGKVVFIDFWASWCAPCRNSIPEIENIFQKNKNKEIVFLGINLDNEPEKTRKFIKIHKINYPILFGNQKVISSYGIRGIPAFFILNHRGEIYKTYQGFYPAMTQKWNNDIKTLLKDLPAKKVIKKPKKKKRKYKKKRYKRRKRRYRKKK